jgi:hypothetical protein
VQLAETVRQGPLSMDAGWVPALRFES